MTPIQNFIAETSEIIEAMTENMMDGDTSTVESNACSLTQEISVFSATFTDDPEKDEIRMVVDELEAMRDEINARISQLEDKARSEFENGGFAFGYEIKEGRVSRSIKDKKVAEEKLLSLGIEHRDIFTSSMVGLPAIEKLLIKEGMKPAERKEFISDFTQETVGAKTMVKSKSGKVGE